MSLVAKNLPLRLEQWLSLSIDRNLALAVLAMIGVVTASNYLVQIEINEWLTWGAFTYPFTFFVTEITNRFYGPKKARQVVWVGFAIVIFLTFFWMNRKIAIASSTAFLVGQLLDISIFNGLRRSSWWVAPATASISASFIDSIIFFSIAFMGDGISWLILGLGDFGVKLVMDLFLLLPFRLFLWNQPNQT